MISLTPAQSKLYAFICEYVRDWGQTPTYAEMMSALGLNSKATIKSTIDGLIERGRLVRTPWRARGLRIATSGMAFVPVVQTTGGEVCW